MSHLKDLKGNRWRSTLPNKDYTVILQSTHDSEIDSEISTSQVDYDEIKNNGNQFVKKVL